MSPPKGGFLIYFKEGNLIMTSLTSTRGRIDTDDSVRPNANCIAVSQLLPVKYPLHDHNSDMNYPS